MARLFLLASLLLLVIPDDGFGSSYSGRRVVGTRNFFEIWRRLRGFRLPRPVTTPTQPPCDSTFIKRPGALLNSDAGFQVMNNLTEDDCLLNCNSRDDCLSVRSYNSGTCTLNVGLIKFTQFDEAGCRQACLDSKVYCRTFLVAHGHSCYLYSKLFTDDYLSYSDDGDVFERESCENQ